MFFYYCTISRFYNDNSYYKKCNFTLLGIVLPNVWVFFSKVLWSRKNPWSFGVRLGFKYIDVIDFFNHIDSNISISMYNFSFYIYTPGSSCETYIENNDAINFFVIGLRYYNFWYSSSSIYSSLLINKSVICFDRNNKNTGVLL